MPTRCVFGACDNVRTSSISLHEYPVEKTLWPRWDRFVRSTRSDFRFGNVRTIVCSAHFTPEDYLNHRMWSMGLVKRLRLNPTAIPSVRPEIVRVSKRKVNERSSAARLKMKMARQVSSHEAMCARLSLFVTSTCIRSKQTSICLPV